MLKMAKMINVDFTLKNIAEETPLLIACKNIFEIKDSSEEIKMIDFFINRDSDVNATDHEGYSALHYAAQNGSIQAVITLLENGADVHIRTKEHNLTPIHLAAKKDHNSDVVKALLQAGAVVKSQEAEELSPLHMSLLGGSSDIIGCLIKNGAGVNCSDKNLQFTPLHLAVYQQRYDLFQLLIDNGADVDGSGKVGLTPLHLSSMLGNLQFTRALISLGARVNCLYDNQLTPLHLATMKSHLIDNPKLMGADAIRYGHEKSLIVKLMTYPCNSIDKDYEAVIRLLVRNGADINAVTKCGWNSLGYAAILGRHTDSFVETLLELGANVDLKVLDSGLTLLHYATKNNYAALVQVLINAGEDVNALTTDGKSPLHLALESNCLEVLKLLLRHGAKFNCRGKRCLYTLMYITARNNDENEIGKLRDYRKIPLLRVIDSLKNNEIRKAVMCLCAIVDACNENGCMPANSEIENDYVDVSKSLRINRVNINDSEVYSKFACDRVLSGSLQELSYIHNQVRKPQYVYDYLSMLNAVKLPLTSNSVTYSRTQSIADFYSSDKVKTHFSNCLDEVDKLKGYSIDDRVTLYEVLHMRPKHRRFYTKILNLCEIESDFKIYYKLILARYHEDIIKKALLDSAQLALSQFIGIELPIICVEEIFADLGIMNMIATIQAADIID